MKRYLLPSIIFILVVFAFYPTTKAGLNDIDDVSLMRYLFANEGWSLGAMFTPGGGVYYRPLVGLLDMFNHHVLGMIPSLLHFSNILFHALNAVLVYLICSMALEEGGYRRKLFPLLAGLLFGLHPVTTESVAWISGHSDLLAAFFVLLSCVMLFKYRKGRRMGALLLTIVFFLCALMSKEVSLAFAPGLGLLLTASATDKSQFQTKRPQHTLLRFSAVLAFAIGSIVMLMNLRGMDRLLANHKMAKTLTMLTDQPMESMALFAKSFGFHFKKILFPWPLSFVITDVDSTYVGYGVALAVVCLLLFLFVRSLPARLLITGSLFFVPALPVALGYIAWTPFAERYAYVACAFIVIAFVVFLEEQLEARRGMIPVATLLISLLLVFGASTTLRACLWADDVAFFADAVEMRPDFYNVRYSYGNALMNDGQFHAAEEQYRQAMILQKDFDGNKFFLHMGVLKTRERRYQEAKTFFEQAVDNNAGEALILSYDKLAWVLNRLLLEDLSPDHDDLYAEQLNVNLKLYELKGDPFFLYRAGQSALALKRNEEARSYFTEAYKKLPSNSMYKPLAEKLMNKL